MRFHASHHVFKNSGGGGEGPFERLKYFSENLPPGGQILCFRGECGRATAKFGVTLFNWAVSLGRQSRKGTLWKSNMGNARSTILLYKW